MSFEKYNHYFDIDPEYFPQINAAIIDKNPEIWKKFYPHETFVQLLKDVVSVISRKQKVSLWVEGAYGTGKSHAVLTLKKLLDASEQDTAEYFDRFKEQLDNDLYKQFQQIKNEDKKILTVHTYGSSGIRDDNDLVFTIQNCIVKALKEKGIEYHGEVALKDAAIKWLSDDIWKQTFDALLKTKYVDLFSGDNADKVIEKLNTYEGEALAYLMKKIMKVGKENRIEVLSMTPNHLCAWIRQVIKENNLKAIVFIWDEFSEYFKNNMRALTGFQELADLSGSDPFYFVLVTHDVANMFSDKDKTWKHLQGRFKSPRCHIKLPENMAFRLMGSAMSKSKDKVILDEWNDIVEDLYDRTISSRDLVMKQAQIKDKELKNILPIHPYTALLMKHISSTFDSNQRSMFDFIKNDRGDEIKGFQWFIKNYGPYDDNLFLTIDLLWDFFYEKGKENLTYEIRSILDCYARTNLQKLDEDEKRVLKAILLLQAISKQNLDRVPLFIGNDKNLNNVFEGSDLEANAPASIAKRLAEYKIVYAKPLGNGKIQYAALLNVADSVEIDKIKKQIKNEATSKLINAGDFGSILPLAGFLNQRYDVRYAAMTDFLQTIRKIRNEKTELDNKISAVMTFAKDDAESVVISDRIQEALKDNSYDMLFIDASITPMGFDLEEQYIEAEANARYQRNKDPRMAEHHEKIAKEKLDNWKKNIENGDFIIYTKEDPQGTRVKTIDQLKEKLIEINRKKYSLGLETGCKVRDTMWLSNSLAKGVENGINQTTIGQFPKELEEFIGEDAWKKDNYWIDFPYSLISKIKQQVEEIIAKGFKEDGRISINAIYDVLIRPPFGFMPCNLTAFVMGFVLKEYVNNKYTWSDGRVNNLLTTEKLKEIVAETIKMQNTPRIRKNEQYIVTMTAEERAFNTVASEAFKIKKEFCTSFEDTRERIRQKMQEFGFPLWCLKEYINSESLEINKKELNKCIDYFVGICNNQNYNKEITDTDLAISIGKLCLDNPGLDEQLKKVINKENCKKGMMIYLDSFKGGILPKLAKNIEDNGQYINEIREKFDADAANWVWNKETADKKIEELIVEYQIIDESSKILSKQKSFDKTIEEWKNICDRIRISYQYAENSWNELKDFMQLIYDIKISPVLSYDQKQNFVKLLQKDGKNFQIFYNNQITKFKEVCSFYLDSHKFDDSELNAIFLSIPANQFMKDKGSYQLVIQDTINKFLAESKEKKLKTLWLEATDTVSPLEWSKKFKMPILCMVPMNEFNEAKEAFDVINKNSATNDAIEKAIKYVKSITYFSALKDEKARAQAFNNFFLKDYALILTNIDEVKDYLLKVLSVTPYDWIIWPGVEDELKKLAEKEYANEGCEKVLQKIESMDPVSIKKYLKKLLKDNMTIGIEIMKDK